MGKPKISRGSLLFEQWFADHPEVTQVDFESLAKGEIEQTSVSKYRLGSRCPKNPARAIIQRLTGIPVEAWDEPAPKAARNARAA